jgi:hypothetical protein
VGLMIARGEEETRYAHNMACTTVLKSRQITHSERTPPFSSPSVRPPHAAETMTRRIWTRSIRRRHCVVATARERNYNIIHKRCHYTYLYYIIIIYTLLVCKTIVAYIYIEMVVKYNRIQYIENGGRFVTSTYIIISVVEIMHGILLYLHNINYEL